MKPPFSKLLKLLHLAERLKFELRHSWLSNGRQESVAEHSWRLSLMVMMFAPYLDQQVNLEKALKMAIIHDIVEAICGDTPTFGMEDKAFKQAKTQREIEAMQKIRIMVDNPLADELHELWHEYENRETYEAKYVHALDKLECQLQHNEADIATWGELEKTISLDRLDQFCDFDSTVFALKETIKAQSMRKLHEEESTV